MKDEQWIKDRIWRLEHNIKSKIESGKLSSYCPGDVDCFRWKDQIELLKEVLE